MANYFAAARSNYFQVKDLPTFRDEAQLYNLDVEDASDPRQKREGLVMIHPNEGCGDTGWPSFVWDDDLEEDVDFDLYGWLAGHLTEGQVAVLEEVGFEKLRYLVGVAVAVNSEGEIRSVQLGDIRQQAWELGEQLTDVSY